MSPRADDVADSAKLVPLAEPRSLSGSERDLLRALVAQVGWSEMDEQVASVIVVAECSCGCPSVGLATDGPRLSPDVVKRLNHGGRDDYVAISAVATNSEGRDVAVTAHVVEGRLGELEVWAGGDGGEVQTELPRPAALRPMADG